MVKPANIIDLFLQGRSLVTVIDPFSLLPAPHWVRIGVGVGSKPSL